jgi:hypothetical protein
MNTNAFKDDAARLAWLAAAPPHKLGALLKSEPGFAEEVIALLIRRIVQLEATVTTLSERLAIVEAVPEIKSALNNAARVRFHREAREARETDRKDA